VWLLAVLGCSLTPESVPIPPDLAETGTPGGPQRAIDPQDDLSGLVLLPCADQRACAPDEAEWLGDTCCAFGDSVTLISRSHSVEGVDGEISGDLMVTCTGFGPVWDRLDPTGAEDLEPNYVYDVPRCQRAALPPPLADGTQRLYVAHHGDGWSPNPGLWFLELMGDEWVVRTALAEPGVLYEGLALTDTHLLVAAHAGGLRSYALAGGVPVFVSQTGGFDNAVKVAVDGTAAWVIDEAHVRTLDITDPENPVIVSSAPTSGKPRDIEVDADRVYVALGVDGLDVFARSAGALQLEQTIDLDGSIQGVALDGDLIALANWDHLAILDRDSLTLLGTEKLQAHYEETLGVAAGGGNILGIEWFGQSLLRYNPGLVAPDVGVAQEFLTYAKDVADSRELKVTNRGPLNLLLGGIRSTDRGLAVDGADLRLFPGESVDIEVSYQPPVAAFSPEIRLFTNDPDEDADPVTVPVSIIGGDKLDVGDKLTDDFGFLDPTGNGELSGLEGQVTVLAYFALF